MQGLLTNRNKIEKKKKKKKNLLLWESETWNIFFSFFIPRVSKLFHKGSGNKYFMLCGPYSMLQQLGPAIRVQK